MFQRNRFNMSQSLSSSSSDLEPKLQMVDTYIPYIAQLLHVVIHQPDIRLEAPLSFEWRGSITTSEAPSRHAEVVYDLIMTLHTKAILHYKLGALAARGGVERLPQAAQHFSMGASVIDYLYKSLIKRWTVHVTSVELRSIEVNLEFNGAFLHLFRAAGQQVAIRKALAKEGGTPPSILSKLFISLADELNMWTRYRETISTEACSKIDSDLLIYTALMRQFALAGVFMYSGKVAQDNAITECGLALGYYQKAKVR